MNANSILTDDEVNRSKAFKQILDTIKGKNNNIKQKIALDESVPSKQKWWAYLDEINHYIDNQL